MTKRFFGTDGIRCRVGKYPMTPDFVVKLGWAAGKVFSQKMPDARVVIGKDTRRSGYFLESALEAGFSAAGVDVYLLGPMSTPGVAYLTRAIRAQAGVVISASHNPHYDNGIKFFCAEGKKLSDEVEMAIEHYLEQDMQMVEPEKLGKAIRIKDAPGRYIEFCKSSVPHFFSLHGMKIVVDCANGATYHIAPHVFQELSAEVITIGNYPNGLNINDHCGSTAPEALQKAVLEHNADVGIAFDGDGDRVIMVDHLGQVVDGDEILYVLANESLQQGKLGTGGVVGTQMSNMGLELALQRSGVPFERAKVGDRHVMEMLQEKGWYIGGESSGHIIWLNSTTTGDGIVAALQVLRIMYEQNLSLRDLLSGMEKFPQVLINVKLTRNLQAKDWDVIHQTEIEVESELGDRGRVLLRASGTEPLIRVMVEAQSQQLAQECADQLAGVVQGLLATAS